MGGKILFIVLLLIVGCSSSSEKQIEDDIAPLINDLKNIKITKAYGPFSGELFIPFVETQGGNYFPLSSNCSMINTYTADITGTNSYGEIVQSQYVIFYSDGNACGVVKSHFNGMALSELKKPYRLQNTFRKCFCDSI